MSVDDFKVSSVTVNTSQGLNRPEREQARQNIDAAQEFIVESLDLIDPEDLYLGRIVSDTETNMPYVYQSIYRKVDGQPYRTWHDITDQVDPDTMRNRIIQEAAILTPSNFKYNPAYVRNAKYPDTPKDWITVYRELYGIGGKYTKYFNTGTSNHDIMMYVGPSNGPDLITGHYYELVEVEESAGWSSLLNLEGTDTVGIRTTPAGKPQIYVPNTGWKCGQWEYNNTISSTEHLSLDNLGSPSSKSVSGFSVADNPLAAMLDEPGVYMVHISGRIHPVAAAPDIVFMRMLANTDSGVVPGIYIPMDRSLNSMGAGNFSLAFAFNTTNHKVKTQRFIPPSTSDPNLLAFAFSGVNKDNPDATRRLNCDIDDLRVAVYSTTIFEGDELSGKYCVRITDGVTVKGTGSSTSQMSVSTIAQYPVLPNTGSADCIVNLLDPTKPYRYYTMDDSAGATLIKDSGIYRIQNGEYVPMTTIHEEPMLMVNGEWRQSRASTKTVLANFPVNYDEMTLIGTLDLSEYYTLSISLSGNASLALFRHDTGERLIAMSDGETRNFIIPAELASVGWDEIDVAASGTGYIRKISMGIHMRGLPENSLSIEFADSTFNPSSLTTGGGDQLLSWMPSLNGQWICTVNSTDWTKLFYNVIPTEQSYRIVSTMSSQVTSFSSAFDGSPVTEITDLDTSSATSLERAFAASTLTSLCTIDASSAYTTSEMLYGSAVETVNISNTSAVTNMSRMFAGCKSLESIPALDISNVTNMNGIFRDCVNVTTGTYALYDAAQQTGKVASYTNAFSRCGVNTINAEEDLTRIPTSWGGIPGGLFRVMVDDSSDAPLAMSSSNKYASRKIERIVDDAGAHTIYEVYPDSTTSYYRLFFNNQYLQKILYAAIPATVTDMEGLASDCYNLTECCTLNTSNVTNLRALFAQCCNLLSVPELDTHSATNMRAMLANCERIHSVPLFKTVQVSNMAYMLYGCTSLESIPLFDTSNVTDMDYMCSYCRNVETGALALYTQAYASGKVTSHSRCFDDCGKDTVSGAAELARIPMSWGGTMSDYRFVVKVIDTDEAREYMLAQSNAIVIAEPGTTDTFIVIPNSQTSYKSLFAGNEYLTEVISANVPDTVTDMAYMFADCTRLTSVPLFDPPNVNTMNSMFEDCGNVESGALALYQQASATGKVTSYTKCFHNCGLNTSTGAVELACIPEDWGGTLASNTFVVKVTDSDDARAYMASQRNYYSATLVDGTTDTFIVTPNSTTSYSSVFRENAYLISVISANVPDTVSSMYAMFSDCTSLSSVPLVNTQNVTDMTHMFFGCTSLASVPLFDTQNVRTMDGVFAHCTSLVSVPLFNTQNATDMRNMFNDCTSLVSVPLFNTQNVTRMQGMFVDCASLVSVPLFDTQNVTNMNSMFEDCINVKSGALALYQQASATGSKVQYHTYAFTNCGINTDTGANELSRIPTSWGGAFGTVVINGNTYNTVKIGNLEWIDRNLSEPTPNFGNKADTTSCWAASSTTAWNTDNSDNAGMCYYAPYVNQDTDSWFSNLLNTASSSGWRIPTIDDVKDLFVAAGYDSSWDVTTHTEGDRTAISNKLLDSRYNTDGGVFDTLGFHAVKGGIIPIDHSSMQSNWYAGIISHFIVSPGTSASKLYSAMITDADPAHMIFVHTNMNVAYRTPIRLCRNAE